MDDEPEVVVHSTGITLSERFQLLHAERGPPGKPRGALKKVANRLGLASEDNVQLLEALASNPIVQRQLKNAANNNQKKKSVKQRLGVKGRLGRPLKDRLGEVQYVRGGGGFARVRRGTDRGPRGSGFVRGRGQSRGRGSPRGGFAGSSPSNRGRGSFVSRGSPRARGGSSRGRGARGSRGRGGVNRADNSGKKPTKEELDAQLDNYMHNKNDDDVLMS